MLTKVLRQRDEEDPGFRLRLAGALRGEPRRDLSFARSLARTTQRLRPQGHGSSRQTRIGGIARGGFVREARGFAQRVVVKAHVVRHTGAAAGGASLKRHQAYLGREGVGRDGELGAFYTRDETGVKAGDITKAWGDDRHHFRFIVSPENAHRIDDLPSYTRSLMATMERDLGTRLDWVAIDHHNTDNPHTHVLVRGRDETGADLVIARDYIANGLRHRAAERATELLGERGRDEIRHSLEREVRADRWTSLDRTLAERAHSGVVDLRPSDTPFARDCDDLLRGRMQHLERLDLATREQSNVWRLADTWRQDLQALGKRGDIIATLHESLGRERAADAAIYSADAGTSVAGRVIAKGPADELSDRQYLVVADARGRATYVDAGRHPSAEEASVGSIVRVGPGAPRSSRADANIAEIARLGGGVYDPAAHRAHVDARMSFIPESERDGYIDAHRIRLETLDRVGLVQADGNGRYRVPDDIEQKARALAERMNADQRGGRFVRIELLSAESLDRQVHRPAFTWLDAELERRGQSKQPPTRFDPETERTLATRANILTERGLATPRGDGVGFGDGVAADLRQAELHRAARTFARERDRPTVELVEGMQVSGRHAGTLKLHSGTYTAIEVGTGIGFARGKPPRDAALGDPLLVTPRRHELALIDRDRDRDRGL